MSKNESKTTISIAVTVENYPQLANRTAKDLGSPLLNSGHMALGVMGEMGELNKAIYLKDNKNIREEAGDILWYIGVESLARGFNFAKLVEEAENRLCGYDDLVTFIPFDFGDLIKKCYAYGKDFNVLRDEIRETMIDTIGAVMYLTYWREGEKFDFLSLLQINIDKLSGRFGDAYSDYAANNRDLESESKTFGKA